MAQSPHPAAAEHLPWFVTAPGGTDVLMIATAGILLLFVLMVGIIYLRLHALPDQLAHQKVQLQIVCVLGLLAMFTHMNIFWVAGLLLALVDFPDFTSFKRIAGSVEKIAHKDRAAKPTDKPLTRDQMTGPPHSISMSRPGAAR